MLTLRLQRVGRKKLPQYRLVAQEHRLTPTSGKVAAHLGSYNPHTKDFNFDKEQTEKYLANGAQPSNRVAILLQKNGVKLPKWVTITQKPEKKKEEPPVEEAVASEAPAETEEVAEADVAEEKTEETSPPEEAEAEAAPAEEPAADEESK